MWDMAASTPWKILATFVVCLIAVASIACLIHTETLDQVHADHPHPSSTHITLDLHCLIAILPATIALVWFCLATLYLTSLWFNPAALVFPLFIPPKDIAHASSLAANDWA
jgi:small-conductance mechanosensitive channel